MTPAYDTTTTQYLWDESASLPLLLQETIGCNTTDYIYGLTVLPLEKDQTSDSCTHILPSEHNPVTMQEAPIALC